MTKTQPKFLSYFGPKMYMQFKAEIGIFSYFYTNQLFFYAGKDDLVSPFMTEAQSEFNQFREDTLKSNEKLTFAIICGDFNFDNMSPSEFLQIWV